MLQRLLGGLFGTVVIGVLLASGVLLAGADGRGIGVSGAIVALAWLVVCVVAAGGCVGVHVAPRRELSLRDQVLAATAVTSHDWMWESDGADRLTYSNHAVSDLLGYATAEVLGRSVFDLLFDGRGTCRGASATGRITA